MAILNNIGNLTKNLHHYVLLSTKINVVYYISYATKYVATNLQFKCNKPTKKSDT